ncbi:hypothetical protein [Nitratidesulfovibrio liaohensis]|uniref:hypothetical protein n=1 Tax=Nitratidesulfovibrio liaohensis TaxID=2604158 RepID=UPI001AAF90BF|nr:hypothetical protein [Nitratidesulfovibrio liaohensis]
MNAVTVQYGLGKGRDCIQLQAHLKHKGLSMSGVARTLGVHHSLVQATVAGTRNNRKVLAYLIKKGVQPHALFPMAWKEPDAYAPAIDKLVRELADLGVQLTGLPQRRRAA